jgi:hypothetical protein
VSLCRVQELEEDLETTETKYTVAMQKYEKVSSAIVTSLLKEHSTSDLSTNSDMSSS